MTDAWIEQFNRWRENYNNMSYADQRNFYDDVATQYPQQIHFTYALWRHFFDRLKYQSLAVLEVGGWRGELAGKMLTEYANIASWHNYEIVQLKQVVTDNRYRFIVPDDFVWNIDLPTADIFVASHTIEHLIGRDLEALIKNLDTRWAVLEAPLSQGVDWHGYHGSHILELGWPEVDDLMKQCNYVLQEEFGDYYQASDFKVFKRTEPPCLMDRRAV